MQHMYVCMLKLYNAFDIWEYAYNTLDIIHQLKFIFIAPFKQINMGFKLLHKWLIRTWDTVNHIQIINKRY